MIHLKSILSVFILKKRFAVILSLIMAYISAYGVNDSTYSCHGNKGFIEGAIWPDTDGKHINAHGGCVLFHNGKYYWYGEQRPFKRGISQDGVNCYSSYDLTAWTPEGLVFVVSETPDCDMERGCIIERPKVVYNKNTGKFVMWFHLELKGKGYEAARYGVAVSDTPEGPFSFVSSGRANPGLYPQNIDENLKHGNDKTGKYKEWTPEWIEAVKNGLFMNRDFNEGQMSRDMTLFVDDDGKAYHIYSSEENLTLHIAELSNDYLSHTGKYIRVAPAGHNEAPMVMKANGKYWMITSGCTGWKPNEARLFMADSLMGTWEQLPNPCIGPNSDITFGGQGNFIFKNPVSGKHIAMFDVWNPESLGNSRHIWLPITFEKNRPVIHWQQYWSPQSDLSAYLFVYFTGNEKDDEAIRYAVSKDGYTFTALNDNFPVIQSSDISQTGGVRDPHIYRGMDGRFYMVLTDMVSAKGWNSNRGLVMMTSDNLIDWNHRAINIQERFEGNDSLLRVWAPQTIYDKNTDKYMVYWSMKHGYDGKDIIYYAYANDDFTDFDTSPKPLFIPADGNSCIDGDIVEKDGKYHLFYKTEGHGNGIKMAVSDSLTSGKWVEYDDYKQLTSDPVEGAAVYRINCTDRYVLMYDVYTEGRYEICETEDLYSFCPATLHLKMDFNPRHGSVISITEEEYNQLVSYFNKK